MFELLLLHRCERRWELLSHPGLSLHPGAPFGRVLYLNYGYPFKVDPPQVMGEPDPAYTAFKERNPVGSYVRDFELPA